ncbi:MAG: SMC family ATPase, partial [Clostridiales bacterium]|nr:SMC family ATPase [Clostridiales bacterium]
MRPVELIFCGVNSYRQEQRVDFSRLGEFGVFGILGPTGSGKSTILDAITLALYGEVSRSAKKSGGVIHLNESQCHVSFTFSLSGRLYRVERLLKKDKKNPFSAVTAACRFYDLDSGAVIASDKTTEVDRAIKELLGLDFEHFSQAVILPQGKFDAFLRLPPGERANALEQLFHLDEYGERLFQKAAQRRRKLEAQLTINAARKQMLGDCGEEKLRESEETLARLTAALEDISSRREQTARHREALLALSRVDEENRALTRRGEELAALAPQREAQQEAWRRAREAQGLERPLRDITRFYHET